MAAEQALIVLLTQLLQTRCQIRDCDAASTIHCVRSMIDDDPAADLSLAMLAGEAALSRFQLIRAFRLATGLTPHAYRVQRRLQLARRLIAQGLPLAEAGLSAGFADQSHLTRLFVRTYGLSPGEFARTSR